MALQGCFEVNFSGIHVLEGFSVGKKIDLSGLEGTCCYCDDDAASRIRQALESVPSDAVHWIDTGDYHYVSLFFLEKIDRPFYLVLLDNHPDDQPTSFGDVLSCGSWRKVAHETLPALKGSVWIQREEDASKLDSIPEGADVYLSIDIDVLGRGEARTDWDQGDMSLAQIESMIRCVSVKYNIVGVDVCGGITESKGASGEDLTINARTNSFFYDLLLNLETKITIR